MLFVSHDLALSSGAQNCGLLLARHWIFFLFYFQTKELNFEIFLELCVCHRVKPTIELDLNCLKWELCALAVNFRFISSKNDPASITKIKWSFFLFFFLLFVGQRFGKSCRKLLTCNTSELIIKVKKLQLVTNLKAPPSVRFLNVLNYKNWVKTEKRDKKTLYVRIVNSIENVRIV